MAYCSRGCEQEAWCAYHQAECPWAEWLKQGSDSSNLGRLTQLALRISLKAGFNNLRRQFEFFGDYNHGGQVDSGFTNGVFLNDYHSVFHMASNKPLRPLKIRRDYAVLAALAIHQLDLDGFFDQNKALRATNPSGDTVGDVKQSAANNVDAKDKICEETDVKETESSYVNSQQCKRDIQSLYGASLVHHMQLIQCNAYGVVQSDVPCAEFRTKEAQYCGLGLYPTMGLLNHSCDPVLDISFQGSTAIYRAFTNVKTGGQITIDYGPIYYLQAREDRQRHLQANYYFQCKCLPCVQDWPLWDNIPCRVPKFKCPECDTYFPDGVAIGTKVQCNNCAQCIDMVALLRELSASHEDFAAALEEAKKGNCRGALPVLKKHLTLMGKVIQLPWREFITCQAAIDQCYIMGSFLEKNEPMTYEP